MKQISKNEKFASKFHSVLADLQTQGKAHPDYESGAFRNEYYEDVFMDLVISQKGLCAYTEETITTKIDDIREQWKDGKYNGEFKRKNFDSTIDHFDSNLKHDDKGWLYDNLFAVLTFINNHKLRKRADVKFKPDNIDYKPETYLKYNFSSHRFVPSPEYIKNHPEMFNPIIEMIEALGINLQTIIDRREDMLMDYKIDIQNGKKTFAEIKKNNLRRFFTAFEMSEDILCAS